MRGKYKAKFDVNDLAKKGDIVTVTSVTKTAVSFTISDKNLVMDKNTFLANFAPHTDRT